MSAVTVSGSTSEGAQMNSVSVVRRGFPRCHPSDWRYRILSHPYEQRALPRRATPRHGAGRSCSPFGEGSPPRTNPFLCATPTPRDGTTPTHLEVALAALPRLPEVAAREEARGRVAREMVDPPLVAQLRLDRVDEGEARAAVAPRGEARVVIVPRDLAAARVADHPVPVRRDGREQVVVLRDHDDVERAAGGGSGSTVVGSRRLQRNRRGPSPRGPSSSPVTRGGWKKKKSSGFSFSRAATSLSFSLVVISFRKKKGASDRASRQSSWPWSETGGFEHGPFAPATAASSACQKRRAETQPNFMYGLSPVVSGSSAVGAVLGFSKLATHARRAMWRSSHSRAVYFATTVRRRPAIRTRHAARRISDRR